MTALDQLHPEYTLPKRSRPHMTDAVDKVGGATVLAPSLLRGWVGVVLCYVGTDLNCRLDIGATGTPLWHQLSRN